jgi:hypothetical protein
MRREATLSFTLADVCGCSMSGQCDVSMCALAQVGIVNVQYKATRTDDAVHVLSRSSKVKVNSYRDRSMQLSYLT